LLLQLHWPKQATQAQKNNQRTIVLVRLTEEVRKYLTMSPTFRFSCNTFNRNFQMT